MVFTRRQRGNFQGQLLEPAKVLQPLEVPMAQSHSPHSTTKTGWSMTENHVMGPWAKTRFRLRHDGFIIVGKPFLGIFPMADQGTFPSFFWRSAGDTPASKRGIPIDGDPRNPCSPSTAESSECGLGCTSGF